MSNNTSNNDNVEKTLGTPENDAVTGVEVVKDDTVMYEDGDFEDYNADQDYESDTDDNSDKDDKSDKNDKSSKKDDSDQDDKSGLTMAGIYQWASKLKDEFKSETADLTHEVTEKAAAMTLNKLLDGVDAELAVFDKSVEAAKKLVDNADEQRKKIASKKDKYQGMIDKLDQ